MESGSLLQSFLGALAAQFDLLDAASAKKVSTICVRMFLPALLITNVGSELHVDTVKRYIPIIGTLLLMSLLCPW